ncbi:MAG: AAA family ATPase [Kiritimatiellia bacterium]|jgi:predicted AAA+ superfamily ATPase|nr:AAA family ATPase [Kiritimatiellia bacterium]
MKRLIEQELVQWKESSRRKPLVLRGARQVGKTWLVEQVLAKDFEALVKIDLEKRRDLHTVFGDNLEPKRILNLLELATEKIIPGKTLLFLDEIQACPRAIMALRYFYEEIPDLHVVVAGSLLEFAFAEISVPVGRLHYLHVHPMTFYEYLMALGKEPMAEQTRKSPSATSQAAHEQIIDELKNYFFTGGMPECVKTWRDTTSLRTVAEVQTEILDSYRDDFAKYTPKTDPRCLDAVLLSVAKSVGEQLKYTRLDETHTGPTNRKSFDLLTKARIIHKISACNPSGLPLGATANPQKFKAAFLDIGLMQRLCQVPIDTEIRQTDLLAIYRGKLAEQFVAQEMLATGSGELFYWSRERRASNAEVDYLLVRNGRIYPVEVKSGAAGALRSLHLMLQTYPGSPAGLVLSSRCYSQLTEQKLIFLPLYCAASLNSEDIPGL